MTLKDRRTQATKLPQIVASVMIAATVLAGDVKRQNSSVPNIVLILVDDVGYMDIGAFAARITNTTTDVLYYDPRESINWQSREPCSHSSTPAPYPTSVGTGHRLRPR